MDAYINPYDDEVFAVDVSSNTRQDFTEMLDRMPELIHLGEEGRQQLPLFRELQADGYSYFVNAAPKIKPQGEVAEAVAPHSELLTYMDGLTETKQLKGMTVGDTVASAFATRRLNQIIQELPDTVKEALREQQSQAEKLRSTQAHIDQLQAILSNELSQEDKEKAEQMLEDQEDLQEIDEGLLAVFNEKAKDALEAEQERVRVAIRDAMAEGMGEVIKAQDALSGLPGWSLGQGGMSQLPVDEQVALARQCQSNAELQIILELAGRLKRIANRHKKHISRSGFDSIIDVELSGRVERLTDDELANLAVEELADDLLIRLSESRAMTWEKDDEEPEGKGPMVVGIDNSGSMSGPPIRWAKAVALVMMDEAIDRGQPFIGIHFSSINEVDVARFEGKPSELPRLLQWLSRFYGNGTHFPTAFTAIEEGLQDIPKADAVFISDMAFPINSIKPQTDHFNELLERLDAQCFAVYVGNPLVGEACAESFKAFCSSAWTVDTNASDGREAITGLFTEMERS